MLPADLDHVAIAVETYDDAWAVLRGRLGGEWAGGGDAIGFSSAQVRFANGMKVEALRPFRVEDNDFLRRFLDASGPGPHHLTFKVPDLAGALPQVEAAGLTPVGVDMSDPGWMEAFLHPKQASGVVVQLAQASGDWDPEPEPEGWPAPGTTPTPALLRVVHAVADPSAALAVFEALLGGRRVEEGDDELGPFVELAWPGPGRVRLVDAGAGRPLADWLGGRPGRVWGLVLGGAGTAEVLEPTPSFGTRLVLQP